MEVALFVININQESQNTFNWRGRACGASPLLGEMKHRRDLPEVRKGKSVSIQVGSKPINI